jgi:hypothetical protein
MKIGDSEQFLGVQKLLTVPDFHFLVSLWFLIYIEGLLLECDQNGNCLHPAGGAA